MTVRNCTTTTITTAISRPIRLSAASGVSALVALAGLWLLAQAYIFRPIAGNFWSDVIVGVALVVLGGYNFYRHSNEHLGSAGVGVFVALLGVWLMITPFILGSTAGTAAVEADTEFWNNLLVGLLVFVFGAHSAYEARNAAPTNHHAHGTPHRRSRKRTGMG